MITELPFILSKFKKYTNPSPGNCFRPVLILLLAYGYLGLNEGMAQVISDVSDPIQLNFGFPKLQVLDDLEFIDENDNNIIDPGEGCIISFTVKNTGAYIAKGIIVRPDELNRIPGLELDEAVEIGDIPPGESRSVKVGIAATDSLLPGTASLIFYINEFGKYDNLSVVRVVDTAK